MIKKLVSLFLHDSFIIKRFQNNIFRAKSFSKEKIKKEGSFKVFFFISIIYFFSGSDRSNPLHGSLHHNHILHGHSTPKNQLKLILHLEDQ